MWNKHMIIVTSLLLVSAPNLTQASDGLHKRTFFDGSSHKKNVKHSHFLSIQNTKQKIYLLYKINLGSISLYMMDFIDVCNTQRIPDASSRDVSKNYAAITQSL